MKRSNKLQTHAASLAGALVAFGSLCAAATAQSVPPPPAWDAPARPAGGPGAISPPRPPAMRPAGPPRLGGTVVAARPYHVQIRTRDGRYVNLNLRNGTVINPIGTTLTPGMRVAVRGTPDRNGAIATDEVDVAVAPPRGPRPGDAARRSGPPAPLPPGAGPAGPGGAPPAPASAGAPPPPAGAGAPPPPAPPQN